MSPVEAWTQFSYTRRCDGKLPECSTCQKAKVPCIVVDRITQRQQPRGHIEDLEAEVTSLRERVRQFELDIAALDSELKSLEQADGVPPASSSGITAANSDSDHNGALRDGPVTQNESSRTSPLLTEIVLSQTSASQEITATLAGPGGIETANRLTVSSLMPTHNTAEQLLETYFTLRWPAFPVLHQPTFVKQHYAEVTQLGSSASPVSVFLTFMVRVN